MTRILTESSDKAFSTEEPENNKSKENEELNEVRQILFGQEQTEIVRLKERMDNHVSVDDVELPR